MKKFKKVFALMLALACIFSLSITAFADDATIDYSKTGTLNIYKYDMTSAAEDGAWTSGSFVASGEFDQSVIDAMADYAVQGVEFSYIRLADVENLEIQENGSHESVMAYGFEENDTSSEFLEALGLDYTDAYHKIDTWCTPGCDSGGHMLCQGSTQELLELSAGAPGRVFQCGSL